MLAHPVLAKIIGPLTSHSMFSPPKLSSNFLHTLDESLSSAPDGLAYSPQLLAGGVSPPEEKHELLAIGTR